jgi:hypothetical protein
MPNPRLKTGRILLFISFVTLYASAAFADKLLYDQWMEIEMNGHKIGFSHQQAVSTDSGYSLNSKSVMKLEVSGSTTEISGSQTSFLDKSYRPLRFTYMQKQLNHQQFIDGVVEGKKLNVTVKSAGNVTKKTVDFGDQVFIADAMGFLLGQKKLEEGKKLSYRVFVEPLLAYETITAEIGKKMEMEISGKKETVVPVTMRFKNFLTVSYISTNGRIVREISPMGFVSQEVDEARAVSFPAGAMSFTSLLSYSLIPLEKPLDNPAQITAMRLRVSGLASKGLVPRDDRQSFTKEEKLTSKDSDAVSMELSIVKNAEARVKRLGRPADAKKFARELAPSVEAQSNDPEIIKQAAKIVGDENDVYRAAVKINKWVNGHVEKKYIDTFSAVDTLKSLEGECQAHTNLFVALARASGIPARTVAGIVYAEDFKGFLYHAWPEVYAGEWIAMDPTFGQDIADATHIKLMESDLSSQLQLFEYLGKIRLEIIRVER